MLLEKPDKRIHIKLKTEQILNLCNKTDSVNDLELLVYELQFRRPHDHDDKERKAAAYLKLLRMYQTNGVKKDDVERGGGVTVTPIKKLITKEIRKKSRIEHTEWRQIGVLKASGYSVSASERLPRSERLKILNCLVMEDDLKDVSDRQYAKEYGEPGTTDRLSKIANSLSMFIHLAEKNKHQDNSQAIQKWADDLNYLKNTYLSKWPLTHWPQY